ncbi:hypothetical protein SBH88_004411, partial [Enterobacter kobei]
TLLLILILKTDIRTVVSLPAIRLAATILPASNVKSCCCYFCFGLPGWLFIIRWVSHPADIFPEGLAQEGVYP